MSTVNESRAEHNQDNEAIHAAQMGASDADGPDLSHLEFGDESEGDQDEVAGPFAKDAGLGDEAMAAIAREKAHHIRVVEINRQISDMAAHLRATEPDLTRRAGAMRKERCFNFKTEDRKTALGMLQTFAVNSDENRVIFFETMFGDGPERPHIDTFRGRFVDHRGVIVDDRYSMVPMIQAMATAGLDKQALDSVRRTFKDWAMLRQTNDLIPRFESRIPKWDETPRMEKRLIELFRPKNTEMNRAIGVYFWLSLYNRIVDPGCQAPIVLSLFGAQNAGKSRFSDNIVQIVLERPKATAVQLDLGSDKNDFLREITGNSIIANVGEMTGFKKGDLNTIKQFITKSGDIMHYKYEGQFEQLRQWITVMDGNQYEGLQRDESGNRRFYPMFVGQLDDKDGKPRWQEGFQADFTDFEASFWQIMAECRDWMKENGSDGYKKLVNETIKMVAKFNAEEMAAGRGTPRDPIIETFFQKALSEYELKWRPDSKAKGIPAGVTIYIDDMVETINELAKGARVSFDSVRRELEVLSKRHGAIDAKLTGGRRGFLFIPASGKTGADGVAEIRALLCDGDTGEF